MPQTDADLKSEIKAFEIYIRAWIAATINSVDVSNNEFKDVYKVWPSPGSLIPLELSNKPLEEEVEHLKIMESMAKCSGCINKEPNQQAHMNFGGCLEPGKIDWTILQNFLLGKH